MMANLKIFQLFLAFLLCLSPTSTLALSFNGRGYIGVFKGTDITKVTPADRVGCLDKYGQFTSTKSDCAVFTHHDAIYAPGFDGSLSTDVGNCTWWFSDRPINSDSKYGKGDHAFECAVDAEVMVNNDYAYSIGLNTICVGDVVCFFDAKSIPLAGQTSLTWIYRWGAEQQGITPGHVQIVWKWEQI